MDPWASARGFFRQDGAPAWVIDEDDQARLQAYELYENIYRINPGTFKLMQRGNEASPIYLPSPRKLIEAINRFLAKDWYYAIQPGVGTPEEQGVTGKLLSRLFKREEMRSNFGMQKRWGLVRGDAIWHVMGDGTKPELGTKVSIKAIDPSNYFPIVDDNDSTKVIGVHLVDLVIDPADKAGTKLVARRQTYRKTETGRITSELGLFEIDKWDDRNLEPNKIKLVKVITKEFELPEAIKSIPVYHIPTGRTPNQIFGTSKLQGVERVMAAINQSITDEDLTLVLQGLGMYWTNSGPPKNADGSTGVWDLGPGQVIEGMGAEFKFERVTGVTTVAPMLDHIKFMGDEMASSLGVSDMASGKVDVTIAESGISLQMQLAPLLSANAELEDEMLGRYDHMLYDITHGWFVAYEGIAADVAVEVVSTVGDPMPTNRDAEVRLIMELVAAKLMSVEEGRNRLIGLGFEEIADADPAKIVAETTALALARNADPFVNRFSSELDSLDGPSGGNPGSPSGNGVVVPGTTVA